VGARTLLFSILLSLITFGAGAQNSLDLTLDQSRQLAQSALADGRPDITLQVAKALLQANAHDAHAFLLMSAAHKAMGKPTDSRKAAALAYRRAKHTPQRLQAAELAADQAFAEQRPTLTQIWLRRAALHTQTEAETDRLARAYRRVRSVNPLNLHFGFAMRPSNNVNNGSNSVLSTIEGVSSVGVIAPQSRALSGTIATFDASARYRLHATNTAMTHVRARTQVRRVRLSSEARAQAPTAQNSDYGWTYADLGLDHVFKVGKRKGDHAQLSATAGGLWSRDETEYTFGRLEARVWVMDENRRFRLDTQVNQFNRDTDVRDSTVYRLRGGIEQKLRNGDSLGVSLSFETSHSDHPNLRSDVARVKLDYAFSRKWGPAEARASLSLSRASYDDFTVVNTLTGRDDRSIDASLSLFFSDYDYAGFAPKVTFSTARRDSSLSLYETRDLSVLFGVQSKF
jgi:hypothetical protein